MVLFFFSAQNSFVRKEDKEKEIMTSKAASPRRARERSAPPKERSRSVKAEKVDKVETTEKTKKSVRLWNLSGRRTETRWPDSWICAKKLRNSQICLKNIFWLCICTWMHMDLYVWLSCQNATSLVQPICPPLAVLCVDITSIELLWG